MKKHPENSSEPCNGSEAIDPRVRRTRKLLQDAFRSLIHEKTFSAITVQDIAERATVNRATFYSHFVDKQDLASATLKDELREALIRRFADPPALTRENLVEFAVVVFELLENGCPENAKDLQDTVGPTLQEGLYENVMFWLSRSSAYRRLFPDSTKEAIATVLAWSIYGGAYRWSRDPRHPSAQQACQEIVSILLPQSPAPADSSATTGAGKLAAGEPLLRRPA